MKGDPTTGHCELNTAARNLPINLRAGRRRRDLFDRTARELGKSRSEFMLEAACREAEEVLLDRRFFQLDIEAFERFKALLDNRPAPTEQWRTLMRRPAPWE
jgi:uncharacterized protein (DUF1778 family)